MGAPARLVIEPERTSFVLAAHTFRHALAHTLPLRPEILADLLGALIGHHHRARLHERRHADDAAGVAVESPRAAAHGTHQQSEEEQVLRDAEDHEGQEGVDQTPHDDEEEEPAGVEDHQRGLGGGRHRVLGHVVNGLLHLVVSDVLQRGEQKEDSGDAPLRPLEGVEQADQGELGITGRELGHVFAPPMRGETCGGERVEMTKSKL